MPGDTRSRLAALLFAAAAAAVLAGPLTAQEGERNRLQVSVGFLAVPAHRGEEGSIELDYRWAKPLVWRAQPRVGAAAYTDGSVYGYAGLFVPINLGDRVVIEPGVAAGTFRGEEIDLGSALEFRSSIAVALRLHRGQRLSLFLYHLSNAGLGHRNPGVEVLGVAYSVTSP